MYCFDSGIPVESTGFRVIGDHHHFKMFVDVRWLWKPKIAGDVCCICMYIVVVLGYGGVDPKGSVRYTREIYDEECKKPANILKILNIV